MLRRSAYFFSKAFGSVRESPWLALLTSGTTGAALLVVGMYVMALQNIEGLALVWGRTATLSAYVDDTLRPEAWDSVRDRVSGLPQIERAVLVRPAEALERFRRRGPEAAALVEGVSPDVLPAAIEVQLRGGFADLAAIERLAAEIRQIDGIADVDYGRQEFDRLQALLELLRYGGLIAGLLVAAATALIVSNTVRLTVYARRDEIAILQLVGATRGFVRIPFLIEGALWGLGGGLMAVLLLWAADRILAPRLTVAVADVVAGLEVHLFSRALGLEMLAGAVVLGIVASGLAVRRFLDVEVL